MFNSFIVKTLFRAELINYLKEMIDSQNIDRWQHEVVHLARIITLGYFVAKLSPLVQYVSSENFVQSRIQKLLEGNDWNLEHR